MFNHDLRQLIPHLKHVGACTSIEDLRKYYMDQLASEIRKAN